MERIKWGGGGGVLRDTEFLRVGEMWHNFSSRFQRFAHMYLCHEQSEGEETVMAISCGLSQGPHSFDFLTDVGYEYEQII
jgi:hypothetical protein